jgi:peptidoglycan/LPS O-acetylase OafA/YrhL
VHTSWIAGAADGDGWDRAYTARVEPAIAVFFLISGFLIYRPFVKARLLDRPALSVRAYGWRRVLRAVPAFWVALTLIAVSVGPDIVGVRSGLRNYLFLQLYHHGGTDAVIPQAWTLSVEIAFYVTLPLWVWLMRRLPARDFRGRFRGEVLGTSALVAGSLAYSAILAYSGATDPITFTPDSVLSALPGYMGHIGMGMLLAVVSVGVERRGVALLPRPLAFLSRHPGLCWAGAIAAAATLTLHDVYTPGQYGT